MTFLQATLENLPGPAALAGLAACALVAYHIIWNLYFHPLAHIQGPWIARASPLYLHALCFFGKECSWTEACHRRYKQKVIRIAPNTLSISDGAALQAIYITGGGFPKDDRYQNFNVENHVTIFSSQNNVYRDIRAKAVQPMVSMTRVRAASNGDGIIRTCTDTWIQLFEEEKALARKSGTNIDLLDMCRKLACDVVTGYFFGKPFGALEEHSLSRAAAMREWEKRHAFSLAPFLTSIVDFGKFALLPNWLFLFCFSIHQSMGRIFANKEIELAFMSLHKYAHGLVDSLSNDDVDTYQARLQSVGASPSEIAAQCKAAVFAGTDSTALNLATLVFHLSRNGSIREKLYAELTSNEDVSDLQTLPYLRAVVKEGLRLSMANPSRFTRIVPDGGVTIDGIHIPSRSIVGAAPYTLHHSPDVFPEPYTFKPERWIDCDEQSRRVQERDLIPFSIGMRACIARNLAQHELFLAVAALVSRRLLDGVHTCKPTIEFEEYFNIGIKNHSLDIYVED